MRPGVRGGLALGAALATAFAACSHPAIHGSGDKGPGGRGAGGAGGGGTAGAPTDASPPDASPPDVPEAGPDPIPGLDPGRVVIHRLNSLEYDNTVRDLLGVEGPARATFQPDERGFFDNDAEAFTVNDVRYEQYFTTAEALADKTFADAGLKARIVTCAPTDAADTGCATRIIRAFGLRAWRRPLTDAEVDRFVQLSRNLMAAGKDFDATIKTVVRTFLSTAPFLYRMEFDQDPTSLVPHAVAPYELASRLSYWLWSTMPDAELFGLAASGQLTQPSVLSAQLGRLLDDPRSKTFVESFAGQWLAVRDLVSHQVEPTAFPDFDQPLRLAMEQEMYLYFSEFLRGARPFDQFLTADMNFVDARLARHYGMDTTGLGAAAVRVEDKTDARKGYLGLAGPMTALSFSYRTYPRYRARWILADLFCSPVEPPANHTLTFPPATVDPDKTFRQQVSAILADPTCGGCHAAFDPIGAGFEQFDAVGHFRTRDEKGHLIDASGVLADGTKFSNEPELADGLAKNHAFLDCSLSRSLTYALGRELVVADAAHLANLGAAWKTRGLTLRALLEEIVLNDTFRFRRGEANP